MDATPACAGGQAEPADDVTNAVRLRGRLSADPDVKDLDSGDRLVLLKLVARRPDGSRHDSLPVVVGPPPAPRTRRRAGQAGRRTITRAAGLSAGDEIEVVGWLSRHFWDAGGRRLSRIQVVAEDLQRC